LQGLAGRVRRHGRLLVGGEAAPKHWRRAASRSAHVIQQRNLPDQTWVVVLDAK
jgi:hypothetical protein